MRGRPTKLTAEIQSAVVADLEQGVPRETACLRAGIGVSTFKGWLRKGREKRSREYVDFLAAVKKAEADDEARDVGRINAAAEGGAEVERTTVTRTANNTTTVTESVKYAVPQWTAAAWKLERKRPHRWGRLRGELDDLKRELQELRKLVGNAQNPDAGRPPAAQ